MANPCSNCHRAPYTEAALLDNQSTDYCSAQEHWPSHLLEEKPEFQELDWWVRKNYFETQQEAYPAKPPFSLDVNQASLQIKLVPKNFEIPLPNPSSNVEVLTDLEGGLFSNGLIQNNEIPLQMETLIKAVGIFVDGPAWYNTGLDRLSVGDYGMLHFITQVSPDLYDDITDPGYVPFDFMVLRMAQDKFPLNFLFPSLQGHQGCFPLGRDEIPGKGMCLENPPEIYNLMECCESTADLMEQGAHFSCLREDHHIPYCKPLEYPDPETNPKLDFGITRLVPEIFRFNNGRLPDSFEINDLLGKIFYLIQNQEPNSTGLAVFLNKLRLLDTGKAPKDLGDLFREGELTFELQDLSDLYIPGYLDLGHTEGKLIANWSTGNGLELSISHLEINVDPMDYPASTTAKQRPPIRLHGATLKNLSPEIPALKIHYDPASQQTSVQMNLNIEADMALPFLGTINIQTPLEFTTRLDRLGHLIPETTRISLSDLKIHRDDKRSPLNTKFNFILSDIPTDDGQHYQETSSKHPHFNIYLGGPLGNGRGSGLEFDGFIPVALQEDHYRLESLGRDFELGASLKWQGPKGTMTTSYLTLNTFKPSPMNSQNNQSDFGIHLRGDMVEGEIPQGLDEAFLPPGHPGFNWLVDEGDLQFTRVKLPDGGFENSFRVNFNELNMGPITLQDVSSQGILDQIRVDEGITKMAIPIFNFEANPKGSDKGLVQGKVSISLEPCIEEGKNTRGLCQGKEPIFKSDDHGKLRLLWDQGKRQLSFENLNLFFDLAGIQLPKLLEKQQRNQRTEQFQSGEKLKRRADALGMDGRLTGHFDFNFDDLKGKGDLRILGDKEGDIYFHSKAGHPVHPPLLKLTKWRFRRFDKIHFDRGYALGAFRLFTRMNTGSLRKFGYSINYETDVIMGHRDVVIKPGGIDEANYNYYRKLLQEAIKKGGLGLLLGEEQP